MTMIIQHISSLLHNHDCVIVPGLGGFVANHRASVIKEDKNLFLPPAKEIGFNRSLIHNDGLLANCISRSEGISFEEALFAIEDFVALVRAEIVIGKNIDLSDIGSLRGDAIGNILFTPATTNSFLPEAFGLTSFRFEPLDYNHTVKFEREIRVPRALKHKSSRYYWGAVAAMMAGLLFLTTSELKTPELNQQAGFLNSLQPTTVFSNTETQAVEIIEPVEVVQEEQDIYTATNNVKAKVNKSFHIIAASFVKQEPAREALQSFVQEGFTNAQILDDEAGRIRIAIESFEHRETAIQKMNSLRNMPRFSSVWVYRSKN
ncbi:HU domain-containing protein [Alkalitalea saponilacus]|uniref:Sporulation related domain-containing protein n=1 Tax=Alkalitalea saponilacus TaxID=889453 RepID=A0A1T5FAW5_9BACT|nr:SPOR domain-containing protein [Alkalitalea saponilacus]ASB50090.1 SPOR domain-containing protein [Alkalitalea saponilacus]SKB93277.1 hypothetical protein SAMN03080601_01572 [Alkalitalea saponilacus]